MTSYLSAQSRSHTRFLNAVLFVAALVTSLVAQAFEWPFGAKEFNQKLSAQDLTPSTRYYARGPSFFSGQLWEEKQFLKQLEAQNYRQREEDQVLMPGDAKKLNLPNCKYLTNNEAIVEGFSCWMWQTHMNEVFIVVVDDKLVIESTWKGDPAARYWKAALDPILVAQYRGQQPIMQNELKISDFPVNCMNATMAIEDNEFLQHSGLSYQGLFRSLVKNIVQRRYAQGGSTITQQLVKNYFLTPEKTMSRKLKELFLAVKLESEWSKDQILETYLNIIYMGQSGAFQVLGFGAASEFYFNKPVQKLNLPECAMLAAIVNNAVINNPWKNPDKATARRNLVLKKMLEYKLISEKELAEAEKFPLPVQTVQKASETAPYYFEAVRKELEKLNLEEPRSIYASLDLDSQQTAQQALQKHISFLEKNKKNLIKNTEKGLKLEGIVLTTENKTGLVTVLVGGQNFKQTQFNRALNGRRQIGSLIKPFVYYLALKDGAEPTTEIQDEKFVWTYEKRSWSPENYDKKYNGNVPLYFALKESLNAPTAKLMQKLGLENLVSETKNFGFTSDIPLTPASSLGASVHYPIEVIDSYRTLANLGKFSGSHFIERVQNKDNETIYEYLPVFEDRGDTQLISVLVGMMKETLKSGTAKSISLSGWEWPAAGKTGTTSDNKDAWFSGFTPNHTTVVWLGYDRSVSSQLTGASGAVPVWLEVMKKIESGWNHQDFAFPETVEKREVPLHNETKNTELIFKK
ncbi:MAG: penicillin-binding protein [Pseudobdellovibrio sp.]|nr:penicillin-binding protein [Pseudobdellovibrio sp.]